MKLHPKLQIIDGSYSKKDENKRCIKRNKQKPTKNIFMNINIFCEYIYSYIKNISSSESKIHYY